MPDSSYFDWFNSAGPQRSYAMQQASPRFAGMAWTQNLLGNDLPGALGTALSQSDREVKDQDKAYMRSGTPFDALAGYLSGKGALTVGDEIMPQSSTHWSDDANLKKSPPPVGQLSISPGGDFNLSSSRGWSMAGSPMSKSLGVTVPAFGNQGTVSLQGSFNQYDPYISGKFQFGRPAQALGNQEDQFSRPARAFGNQEEINTGKAESAVTAALGPEQQAETLSKPSVREQADQLINAFRSSGGRDLNSPTSWGY
jgi:hypothetical protein